MREDREYRFARGALQTPESDPTQPDTPVMRAARQASAAATDRLVFQLKTQRQHKGHDTFEKRLAIAKQLKVGRFVLKIDSDGPVCTWLFGCVTHVPPRVSGLCYA